MSLWTNITQKPNFPSLDGDISTDVLIIGGGLAGILCAYKLHQAGIDYTLIESKEICSGITKNTTAKVTVQHGLIYDKIIKQYGVSAAKKYYYANSEALKEYENLCQDLGCSFEKKNAFVYSLTDPKALQDELNAYNTIDASGELTLDSTLPFEIIGAIKLENQGQINPLEFLYKLSQNLNIKENTKLINLLPKSAETNKGKIHFKKAIFTTHFPLLNKHGFYFLKLYQHRSYVLALENAQEIDGMYIDADIQGLSFRNYNDLLLLGGGSHRTGKTGGSYSELLEFAKKYYPNAKIVSQFATQDCMTLDGIPYIGQYSKNTPDLFVATGFNKWGFTNSFAAAQILCDEIRGAKNKYADVFSPSRKILHPQLAINSFEAIKNILTPTTPRCPHLGCALKYNKTEHTWDCTCHGSRFTESGALIDSPATDDINLNSKI